MSDATTRQPFRAGSFYEADPKALRRSAEELIRQAALPEDLPARLYGGLLPHAGWAFSGAIAATTLKALAERKRLARVVIFGADHWGIDGDSAVYDRGAWATPLGKVPVDEELAAALLKGCPKLRSDPEAHRREHSIEVQLPLMQVLSPEVKIVPISAPPSRVAAEIGRAVGQVLKDGFPDASVVGSTDLTHYGPQYGFTPGGTGPAGVEWAQDNDRHLLQLIQAMRAEDIVAEAARRQNACGAGAIAASIAACSARGATRAVLLQYTTSADVMESKFHTTADDAVGYAAVVFA